MDGDGMEMEWMEMEWRAIEAGLQWVPVAAVGVNNASRARTGTAG